MIMSINKKEWNEFRETGLLLLINQFLHIFGWCIVVVIEYDVVKACFPARTKYRGFDEKSTSEAYVKISEYMSENGKELEQEVKK
jgi:hypothetical protein